MSTIDLKIGRASIEGDFTVLFVWRDVQLSNDREPIFVRCKSWYFALQEPKEPVDTYALFEELPKLLKRPGHLVFEFDAGVSEWIREELQAQTVVGLVFRDDHKGPLPLAKLRLKPTSSG